MLDLNAPVWQWPATSEWNNDLMLENLAAIWPNYSRRGVTHLVLARVVETLTELDKCRSAILFRPRRSTGSSRPGREPSEDGSAVRHG